jgi:hypothetical protein
MMIKNDLVEISLERDEMIDLKIQSIEELERVLSILVPKAREIGYHQEPVKRKKK